MVSQDNNSMWLHPGAISIFKASLRFMKKSHCNSQQHCGRKTTNWFFGETPNYRGPVHKEPLNRPPAPKRMYINKLFLSLEEGKAPRAALPEAYVPAQPPCETPWAWLQINLVITCLSWLEISAERVALTFPCLVVLCLLALALLHGLFSLTDISQKQSEMKKGKFFGWICTSWGHKIISHISR